MGDAYLFDIIKDMLPVLSGLLGVLGILNVFKTSNNRLSFWGWLAVFVIVISTIATLLLAKKEKNDNEREKIQLQNKIDNILRDVAKAREPIGEVSITYWSLLPDSNQLVRKYKDYLNEKARGEVENFSFHNLTKTNKDYFGTTIDLDGKLAVFSIDEKNKYWPSGSFSEIGLLASNFSIMLCINSKHTNAKDVRFIIGARNNLDWGALALLPRTSDIFYDVKKDKIGLATTITYDKKWVYSNGVISSVRDFFGSDVFFVLPSTDSRFLNDYLKSIGAPQTLIESNKIKSEIIAGMSTESVSVKMGDGQRFNISGEHLKKYNSKDGRTFFYIKMPLSEKEVSELETKN